MTTVEVERAGVFEDIPFGDFAIETGTSDTRLAPEATITTSNNVAIQPNQRLRITIDGTTRFEGTTISGGSRRGDGRRRVQAEHDAFRIFNEAVSVSGSDNAATILSDALAATTFGSFTLDYTGTSETLAETYDADGRKVKQIFRDIADRTNRVFWVDAVANTITVQPRGGRGEFASVTLPGDPASVQQYENGSVRSVENDITVVGTGEERVEGRATDSTSISDYGRRSEQYNVAYVTTQAEAENAAAELLSPDPLDSAKVLLGSSIGTNPDQTLANYQLRVTDPSVGLNDDVFVIQSQKIEQGRVEVDIGEAATSGIDSINRTQKSNRDTADVGSVINAELGDGAVDTPQLVDTAVIEQKLADAGVSSGKLVDGAVIEQKLADAGVTSGKLADLSVSETKIQDGSISTPKLTAGAVTANEIAAFTITGNEIVGNTITGTKLESETITADEISSQTITSNKLVAGAIDTLRIEAGAVTANEIRAGTITADQISTLDLDTDELSIGAGLDGVIEFQDVSAGTDTIAVMVPNRDDDCFVGLPGTRFAEAHFREVNANNFVTQTPEPHGGDVDLSKLGGYTWRNPPEYVAQRKAGDGSFERANPNDGVEVAHYANYLLEVCKEQQQTIDDQADRIDDLETRLETLEAEVGVGPNA